MFNKKYFILVFFVFLIAITSVSAQDDAVASQDLNELSFNDNVVLDTSTDAEHYADGAIRQDTGQTADDLINLSECSSAVLQVSDNEGVICVRRDAANAADIYIESGNWGDIGYLKQYKTSGGYFSHAIVTSNGWLIGNGGVTDGSVFRQIESIASEMVVTNQITNDYLSRMITSQNGKEYDYRNYDGMKKTYVIWILPQAAKKRDGHVNCYKTNEHNISGSTIERLESYDKSEQIMIYLNKDHDIKDKYEGSDWIKTPLVIFLNNTYDLLKKKEIMKEYGFEEIEKEVKKMCNLGEMIARENIEKGHSMGLEQGLVQGQKLERITSIKNLMKKMAIPLDKAMDLLDLSSIEKEEMKKHFQS